MAMTTLAEKLHGRLLPAYTVEPVPRGKTRAWGAGVSTGVAVGSGTGISGAFLEQLANERVAAMTRIQGLEIIMKTSMANGIACSKRI